jgi:hypothetical protein
VDICFLGWCDNADWMNAMAALLSPSRCCPVTFGSPSKVWPNILATSQVGSNEYPWAPFLVPHLFLWWCYLGSSEDEDALIYTAANHSLSFLLGGCWPWNMPEPQLPWQDASFQHNHMQWLLSEVKSFLTLGDSTYMVIIQKHFQELASNLGCFSLCGVG